MAIAFITPTASVTIDLRSMFLILFPQKNIYKEKRDEQRKDRTKFFHKWEISFRNLSFPERSAARTRSLSSVFFSFQNCWLSLLWKFLGQTKNFRPERPQRRGRKK